MKVAKYASKLTAKNSAIFTKNFSDALGDTFKEVINPKA